MRSGDRRRSAQMAERPTQAHRVPGAQHGRRAAAVLGTEVGGRWNEGALPFVRDLVRVRAQRALPVSELLQAKVVVPVGSLSTAGRCCHSIGQYVVVAGMRQPGAWPRARPGSQLGRVAGTQPIAAAVGSRRPRHMLQTQKGPRKKKKKKKNRQTIRAGVNGVRDAPSLQTAE